MKNWLLVGHRGVGKTSLLNELKAHFSSNFEFYSLDQEIELRSGKNIADIFLSESEEAFRVIEEKIFLEIVGEKTERFKIVDVGAGFQGEKPLDWKGLWLKRKIDSSRSLFLNRPKLSNNLRIQTDRFLEREKRYMKMSDFEVLLPEGLGCLTKQDLFFFSALFNGHSREKREAHWGWTVQGENSGFKRELLRKLGFRLFEWRDDLVKLPLEHDVPEENFVSYRKSRKVMNPPSNRWDWPLEWGENQEAWLLSLHSREKSLGETFKKFPNTKQILKLAIPIQNFSELKEGHQWVLEDPDNRVFLPMSEDGRWAWYRLLSSRWNKINFLKIDKGSAPDQPTLFEVLNFNADFCSFAAILGAPVEHSHTPRFHQTFFEKRKSNVLRINIDEEEFHEALPFLFDLGLRWAAITSPLKKRAAQWSQSSLPSINTLAWTQQGWKSTNTDVIGFEKLLEGYNDPSKVVWGGGGTLDPLRKVLPALSVYSSRKGNLKEGEEIQNPKVLIWAVGASSFEKKGVYPPKDWPIHTVLDLNYTQDSPGRECASRYGCQYRSGLAMFEAQAKAQQEFWSKYGVQ